MQIVETVCSVNVHVNEASTESERFSAQSDRPSVVSRAAPAEEDGTAAGWENLWGGMPQKLRQLEKKMGRLEIVQETDLLGRYM